MSPIKSQLLRLMRRSFDWLQRQPQPSHKMTTSCTWFLLGYLWAVLYLAPIQWAGGSPITATLSLLQRNNHTMWGAQVQLTWQVSLGDTSMTQWQHFDVLTSAKTGMVSNLYLKNIINKHNTNTLTHLISLPTTFFLYVWVVWPIEVQKRSEAFLVGYLGYFAGWGLFVQEFLKELPVT